MRVIFFSKKSYFHDSFPLTCNVPPVRTTAAQDTDTLGD